MYVSLGSLDIFEKSGRTIHHFHPTGKLIFYSFRAMKMRYCFIYSNFKKTKSQRNHSFLIKDGICKTQAAFISSKTDTWMFFPLYGYPVSALFHPKRKFTLFRSSEEKKSGLPKLGTRGRNGGWGGGVVDFHEHDIITTSLLPPSRKMADRMSAFPKLAFAGKPGNNKNFRIV